MAAPTHSDDHVIYLVIGTVLTVTLSAFGMIAFLIERGGGETATITASLAAFALAVINAITAILALVLKRH